jgi:phosphoenolpyruvate carboxylase
MAEVKVDQRKLRDEIRWLGELLGEVLREQAGPDAFDLVEEIRALARERRAGEEGAEARLVERIRSLPPADLEPLIGALSVFFDLANLSEDRQRVRVVRERERSGAAPGTETLGEAVQELAAEGLTARAMRSLLEETGIEFVFTAHPTEAKRRSVREKVRDLRGHLHDLDDPDLLSRERTRLERLVKADLTGLWQTEFVRFRRPSVLEELDRSLFFAGNLWQVVPELLRELDDALDTQFPGHDFGGPTPVRFATWVGGDRDGNPNVTAQVTRKALQRLRDEALSRHIEQARRTRRNLSMSARKAGSSRDLLDAIHDAKKRWPVLAEVVEHLSHTEPYRRWLWVVQWRLERTREADLLEELPQGAYGDPGEMVQELELMRRSLASHGGELLAQAHLDPWIRQVRVFGFSLMRLDIRQESSWYEKVLAEILADLGVHPDYRSLEEDERQRVLTEAMPSGEDPAGGPSGEPLPEPSLESLSDDAREAVDLFTLLASVCRVTGPEVLGAQVISMTHRPSDVLAVLWLSSWAAVRAELPGGWIPIPIAPLFETIDDLRNAPDVLDALLAQPAYRRQVAALGDRQMVMVGYSDSTKDGGYLAASWSLHEAQFRMQEPARRHGVSLVFFHGRGGALGRGGGPAARHIRSLPPQTLRAGLRITEQGEVLSERYDDPWIARRHLQQMLSSVLRSAGGAKLGAGGHEPESPGLLFELIPALARRSRAAYRELVEIPGFIRYFEEATPITQIEELPIGSRPSRRRPDRSLETLRAIPWVFSWTQSRHLLPAWYGIGSALEPELEEGGESWTALRSLYAGGGFFRATIDNAALALAKADMGIAGLHGALVEDAEVREAVDARIQAEHERARRAVLDLTGQQDLLDDIPWLKRSIDVRNPYVDPLNMIQVELFRRLRTAEEGSPEAEAAAALIRLTIQGIAGGLRTTG